MSKTNSLKVKRERAELLSQARMLIDNSEKQKRDLNSDEKEQWDKMMADVDALEERITRLESLEDAEGENEESAGRKSRDDDADHKDGEDDKDKDRHRSRGMWDVRGENRTRNVLATPEYRKAYAAYLKTGRISEQFRDVSTTGSDGGQYLAAPIQVSADIVVAINNYTFIRELANVEQVTQAVSLGCPRVATDLSDADWTAEVPSPDIASDTSLLIDRRDLTPNVLTKLALVSMRELSVAPQVENVVNQRLAYKFAVAQEKAFLTGNHTGKPLGVFTASASGISTARDVTASATTSFSADDLLNVVYAIPSQYQQSPKFSWIMHRDAVKMARKLKSAMGEYLLQAGIALNRGDTLCGYPLRQSEYAPNTFTTGLYVAILGDFNFYKVAEVSGEYGGYAVQRLVERFALSNQVGFLGRQWIDGMPTLELAFGRLKLS